MAHKKDFRINCSNLSLIRVSRPACLAMIASACEVYPMECMGTLCCSRIPKRKGRIRVAFPYQLAERGRDEVASESFGMFRKMLSGKESWHVIGSYHSHPCKEYISTPSKDDLETMEVGDLELIIRTFRQRRKMNYWRTTSSGNISVAWGKFRFLIRAFVRLKGYDDSLWPLYKSVALELDE